MLYRFIPTSVGNTIRAIISSFVIPVHPHVCGEHPITLSELADQAGSSPRLWGTRLDIRGAFSMARFIPTSVGNTLRISILTSSPRFIPTSVGNTFRSSPRCRTRPVHPHVCGEHSTGRTKTGRLFGSSPRLWGTRYRKMIRQIATRFIPTSVGNTYSSAMVPILETVHPHVCGEHAER